MEVLWVLNFFLFFFLLACFGVFPHFPTGFYSGVDICVQGDFVLLDRLVLVTLERVRTVVL